MDATLLLSACLLLSSLFSLKLLFSFFSSSNKLKSPPPPPAVPRSLPLIGHFHILKKPLHHALARIAARHGPLLLLRFGSRPVLLVSSAALAEECFTKHDLAFANRPQFPSAKHLSYNFSTLGFAPYGPLWRDSRRIAALELLSTHRLNSFADLRASEVRALISGLIRATILGSTKIELKSRLFGVAANAMMRMIAGRGFYGDGIQDSCEARRFREIVEEVFKLTGASTSVGDFLPALRIVDELSGTRRKKARLARIRDEFMQGLIDEHRRKAGDSAGEEEGKKKTLIGVLLSLQESDPEYYTDRIIKALVVSLLSAGTDTTSDTIEWAMALLLNNPDVLKKARDEIDAKLEKGRLITETDVTKLPYLQCIVTETLRLYPAGPLLVPHESTERCAVGEFHVERGTMLLVNAYMIHRDPNAWPEPTVFKPERFMDGKGPGSKMLPFGKGRRRCPGEGHAMRVVSLTLGAMIQCFEWERVGQEEVDMEEGPGLTLPKARPLEAVCRPRYEMVDVLSQL